MSELQIMGCIKGLEQIGLIFKQMDEQHIYFEIPQTIFDTKKEEISRANIFLLKQHRLTIKYSITNPIHPTIEEAKQ